MPEFLDPTPVWVRRDGDVREVRADKVLPTDFVVASDAEVTAMRARIRELEAKCFVLCRTLDARDEDVARAYTKVDDLTAKVAELEADAVAIKKLIDEPAKPAPKAAKRATAAKNGAAHDG